jgi:hypothetical protein
MNAMRHWTLIRIANHAIASMQKAWVTFITNLEMDSKEKQQVLLLQQSCSPFANFSLRHAMNSLHQMLNTLPANMHPE